MENVLKDEVEAGMIARRLSYPVQMSEDIDLDQGGSGDLGGTNNFVLILLEFEILIRYSSEIVK